MTLSGNLASGGTIVTFTPKTPFFIFTWTVEVLMNFRAGSPALGTYPSLTFSKRPLLLLRGPFRRISHPMAPDSMVLFRAQKTARL